MGMRHRWKLVDTLATSKKQNSPGNKMCLFWKTLDKLLTDGPIWQNQNFSPQALPPCSRCPHDLWVFWCCHQFIPSNQNVHLPCRVSWAVLLCSPAICLFSVTGVTVSYSVCGTESLKSRNPCFSIRALQIHWVLCVSVSFVRRMHKWLARRNLHSTVSAHASAKTGACYAFSFMNLHKIY